MIESHMGTYPFFSFTPDDSAIVIWATGQIWRVPLARNDAGERVPSSEKPTTIPFKAKIRKRLAETMKSNLDLTKLQTAPTQRLQVFRDLSIDDKGEQAIFEGAGASYVQDLKSGRITKVPAIHPRLSYYQPSFIPNQPSYVIHARWSENNFTTFEIVHLPSGRVFELTNLPFGRYASPTICECIGMGRKIAFVRTGGDFLTGTGTATTGEGLYVGQITLPDPDTSIKTIEIKNLKKVDIDVLEFSDGDVRTPRLRFYDGSNVLLVQQTQRAFQIDFKDIHNDVPIIQEIAKGKMSSELAVGVNGASISSFSFVDFNHIFHVPAEQLTPNKPLWSKPGDSTPGVARLSLDGGHDIVFSRDGKKLFWLLGR